MEIANPTPWGHDICMYCGHPLAVPFNSAVHREGTTAHLCEWCAGKATHIASALIKVTEVATRARERRALEPDALDRELRRITGTFGKPRQT